MSPQSTDTVVIGAGPAGLATATCLARHGVSHVLLEREETVGSAWRRHYDRLHLHTNNRVSHLPYLRFPRGVPRWPSRQQVIEYLERYTQHHRLQPRLGHEVVEVRRDGDAWQTRTARNGTFQSDNVVIATGYTGQPVLPRWPGMPSYPGTILHSSRYRNGEPFRGKSVLVVGFGNSAGEIALDLAEQGARPALSVRGSVSVIPRQLLGIPILAIAIPLSRLPPTLADALTAPILKLRFPDLRRLGLQASRKGPFRRIAEERRIPLIDIGTIRLLRQGRAKVRPAIKRFDGGRVVFADGSAEVFDAVVLATGYRPSFSDFLREAAEVSDDRGVPRISGAPTSLPGLYFCGFYVSPTGMLRQMSIEARRIAAHIAGRGRESRRH